MRCVLVCPQCLAESGNVSKKKIKSGKRHDFTLWWKVMEVAYTRQVLE